MAFEGCIILNLGFVGTEHGFTSDSRAVLEMWRSAYDGKLLYGGGVASVADLELILEAGYDGVIVATALHKGAIPVEWIRRGCMC
jgi:phosphoribosylformimino-5-aminoimidazole carboxamide ribotide isomerase